MELTIIEGPGPANDSSRSGRLEILVTVLGGHHFLDVRPREIRNLPIPVFEQTLLVPMHAVIRYHMSGDSLQLQYLNYREFDRKSRKGRVFSLEVERVRNDGPLLITSNTETLRRFLAKYGSDEALFDEPSVYLRQK